MPTKLIYQDAVTGQVSAKTVDEVPAEVVSIMQKRAERLRETALNRTEVHPDGGGHLLRCPSCGAPTLVEVAPVVDTTYHLTIQHGDSRWSFSRSWLVGYDDFGYMQPGLDGIIALNVAEQCELHKVREP